MLCEVAFAAMLGIAPPDPSTEAPVARPPAGPSTEAPAVVAPPPTDPVSTVFVPPAPGQPVRHARPIPPVPPPEPPTGRALIGIGSALLAIGLSAQIGAAAGQAVRCQTWFERDFYDVHHCFDRTEPWPVHPGMAVAGGSALVLSSIGAAMLGQHHAWKTEFGDRPPRNSQLQVVAGVIFMTLGLGALAADGLLVYRRDSEPDCTSHACEVQRRVAYYTLGDVGSLSLIAGLGLVAYSSNYKNRRLRYGTRWALMPRASPTMFGGSAMLRF